MLKPLQDIRARTFTPPILPTLPALMRSASSFRAFVWQMSAQIKDPLKMCPQSSHCLVQAVLTPHRSRPLKGRETRVYTFLTYQK